MFHIDPSYLCSCEIQQYWAVPIIERSLLVAQKSSVALQLNFNYVLLSYTYTAPSGVCEYHRSGVTHSIAQNYRSLYAHSMICDPTFSYRKLTTTTIEAASQHATLHVLLAVVSTTSLDFSSATVSLPIKSDTSLLRHVDRYRPQPKIFIPLQASCQRVISALSWPVSNSFSLCTLGDHVNFFFFF